MRFDRDRLAFLLLASLYEVTSGLDERPAKPTLALRAILASLYSLSDGNREPYDAFWRNCLSDHRDQAGETQSRYVRSAYSRSAWEGIARTVGQPPDIDFMQRIFRACRRP